MKQFDIHYLTGSTFFLKLVSLLTDDSETKNRVVNCFGSLTGGNALRVFPKTVKKNIGKYEIKATVREVGGSPKFTLKCDDKVVLTLVDNISSYKGEKIETVHPLKEINELLISAKLIPIQGTSQAADSAISSKCPSLVNRD